MRAGDVDMGTGRNAGRGRPPAADPELVLYETLRRGSGRAFRRLLELHEPGMRRVAGWYADDAGARAVVLETWAIGLDGLNMFTWHTTFRAWLFGILVSVGRGAGPSDDRRPTPVRMPAPALMPVPSPQRGPAPGRAAPVGPVRPVDWATLPWDPRWTAASWRALEDGVAALPWPAREVVLLHDAEGWPLPEALDVLQHTGAEGAALLEAGRRGLRDAVAAHLGLAVPGAAGRSPVTTAEQVAGLREAFRGSGLDAPAPSDPALLAAFRAWRTRRDIGALRRLGAAVTAARAIPSSRPTTPGALTTPDRLPTTRERS